MTTGNSSPGSPGILRVALVGPRAAGKTTVAQALGRRLGWAVVDTDEGVALRVGRSAGTFLAEAGEAEFRRVEAEVCVEAFNTGNAPTVISLGGGAVVADAVRRLMREPSVLGVFLEAPLATLVSRQRAAPRPPLSELPLEDEVRQLLELRRGLYVGVSQLLINTRSSNVDACVTAILDKMAGLA